jgi:restriction system protein
MAIWLIRAGSHSEYAQKLIQEGRVYVTWGELNLDLSKLQQRGELTAEMTQRYPEAQPKAVLNWVSQVWPFAHEMRKGALVVLPLTSQPAVYIGEITGDYHAETAGPPPFSHWRSVKWISEAMPRTHLGKDLLFSFGAFLTICRIQRHNAEQHIASMRTNGWKAETLAAPAQAATARTAEVQTADADLDELARDPIAALVSARFKGYGRTRRVEGMLAASLT